MTMSDRRNGLPESVTMTRNFLIVALVLGMLIVLEAVPLLGTTTGVCTALGVQTFLMVVLMVVTLKSREKVDVAPEMGVPKVSLARLNAPGMIAPTRT
jgi:hypothetical protein